MLTASDYFDIYATDHGALFTGTTYVWEALERLPDYIDNLLNTTHPPNTTWAQLHPTVVVEGKVHIGTGAEIAPHTYIQGPTIIGAMAQVRQGAHVRSHTLIGSRAIVGHATETKVTALLEGAAAPHFSYVGDSILGRDVNLGAGTKLSNFPMNADIAPDTGERPTIHLPHNGGEIDTGLVKMGAILGDGVQCGCNCVTNPGVLVGPRTMVYTLTMLRKGIYPPNSVIKLRQTQEIVERR